jgi:hypothetical protein
MDSCQLEQTLLNQEATADTDSISPVKTTGTIPCSCNNWDQLERDSISAIGRSCTVRILYFISIYIGCSGYQRCTLEKHEKFRFQSLCWYTRTCTLCRDTVHWQNWRNPLFILGHYTQSSMTVLGVEINIKLTRTLDIILHVALAPLSVHLCHYAPSGVTVRAVEINFTLTGQAPLHRKFRSSRDVLYAERRNNKCREYYFNKMV